MSIPKWIQAVAVIAAVGAVIWGVQEWEASVYDRGHKAGADEVQARWDAEKIKREESEKAAILTRIEENRLAKERDEAERQKLKKGYANEIAKIRADHARDAATGLHVDASICSGFAGSGQAESAGGSNARAAATVLLPEPTERDLRALMKEADTIVAGCRVGQEFVRVNGMAP